MSTNPQKRITKQVRIAIDCHKLLKIQAINKGMTMAKYLEEIIKSHYEQEN